MADQSQARRLFLGCFIALVATAFGFAVRGAVLEDWARQFSLSEEQKGIINGVGLYPFAISIILFSLIIDRIGYGTAMAFAFLGHIASTVLTIFAPNFRSPLFRDIHLRTVERHRGGRDQSGCRHGLQRQQDALAEHPARRLAGWHGACRAVGDWRANRRAPAWGRRFLASCGNGKWAFWCCRSLSTARCSPACAFPTQERVVAGVSYNEMLSEFGWGSAYIVSFLLIMGISQILTVLNGATAIDVGLAPTCRATPSDSDPRCFSPCSFARLAGRCSCSCCW